MCIGFFLLASFTVVIGKPELLPEVISSLVIALLTLALVWTELSKRPELRLLDLVPGTYNSQGAYGPEHCRADRKPGQMTKPSRFLGIVEASYPGTDLKFDKSLDFEVDLANIGYEEIYVHEFVVLIDGERKDPEGLHVALKTQQRHEINSRQLGIEKPGFHRVRIEALATTTKVYREVWFFISDDFKKLRYVHVYPLKRLLSHFIRHALADP